ncbi:MAG: TonB-dependent receptor plug domain-containing protein [Gemmatimonadaceae bacterium]|nr:TonB-dependent receptor plug domain-containing protein [Gemmatimonadaceae bacterium]
MSDITSGFTSTFATLLGSGTVAFLVSWMATASIVSLLLALVAVLAERVLKDVVPARLIWGLALFAAVSFSLSQPWRRATAAPESLTVVARVIESPSAATAPVAPSLALTIRNALAAAPSRLRNMSSALATRVAALPSPASKGLLVVWPFATLLLGGLLAVSYRRQFRRAGRAPTAMVGTQQVRLSDDFGPAVVGVRAPLIVVPRWLLERSPLEQQMVVVHEQSHVAAHDPLLLLSSCLAVVLLPWNAALWFMASRMRLAIEIDCDARVLAGGRSRRHYGQLLIELSAAPSTMRGLQGVPAFSYRASHLERRLHTMTARPANFPKFRRAAGVVLASAGVLAACSAELPTAAQVEALDAASAQKQVAALTRTEADTRYFVNDVEKTKAEAEAILSDKISTIDIRSAEGGKRRMFIRTTDAASADGVLGKIVSDKPFTVTLDADSNQQVKGRIMLRKVEGGPITVSDDSMPRLRLRATNNPNAVKPLVVVDGKRMTMEEMRNVSPNSIASVEVLKSAAATAQYGTEGANGVIVVTTKR